MPIINQGELVEVNKHKQTTRLVDFKVTICLEYSNHLCMSLLSVKLTASSTWWCDPRPCLGWVEMAVDLAECPIYPGKHAVSPKLVDCFLSSSLLLSSPYSYSPSSDERKRSS